MAPSSPPPRKRMHRYYYDFRQEWNAEPALLRFLHAIPVTVCGILVFVPVVVLVLAIAAFAIVLFITWKVLEFPYLVARGIHRKLFRRPGRVEVIHP